MPSTSSTSSAPPSMPARYSIPFFLALIVAGLAGDYFKYPIFLNIDFLFGSVFAMLALQFFGIGRGIVAAAIISSYTYILWNHPYAIIIMTAEVAVVGWLFNRRRMGMVIADMLYWLIIGMPLIYLFYRVVMHTPLSNLSITMAKQAMNGITNALAARLIFTGYALLTRSSITSYREIIYNLLSFFVLFPALTILMTNSRTDFNEIDHNIRTTLTQMIQHDARFLESWVSDQKTATVYLAELAALQTPQQMQSHLEQATKSNSCFLRIGLQDKAATIVAYFPLIDELGQKNIGKNYADRPYYPILKNERKPMLSEVVMGRVGKHKPFVAMLAPVITHGEYGGCITSILNLEKVNEILIKNDGNDIHYTLIDKNGNVIMTNRTDQRVMTHFVRNKGVMKRLNDQVSQWIPQLPPTTPASERWKKSFYVAETTIGGLAEWKLVLEQPVAPFQKKLFDNYTVKFTMMFGIMVVALVLAELLSRQLISTHKKLLNVSRDLPSKVATNAKIDWPESGIFEVMNLISNFRETSDSLATQFYEIQQINESLEQHVAERTSELTTITHEVSIILENAPVGIAKIMDKNIAWSNRKLSEMFDYSKKELVAGTTRKLFQSQEAFDKLVQEAFELHVQGLTFQTEQEFIKKDGSHILVRYVSTAIEPADLSKGSICLMEDITRHRQEEAERKAFEQQYQETQRLESLGVLAGGIAHDFNNLLAIIMGNCSLAKMSPEKFTNNLDAIEKATERAAALCRQMLDYAGHTQVAKTQIEIRSLVDDMVGLMASTGHKNIVIKAIISPNIPLIHGDASQIRQILLNLLTNATEAIGEAQGEIDVMLTKTSVDADQPEKDHLGRVIPVGTYACLEVTDNGCGMNEETQHKIFEPFFTTKFTGRGLGLSATLGIITGHDGALQLFSQPGNGTIFKVYLPAQDKDSTIESIRHITPASWRGSSTILLVEDEDQVRLIAKKILNQFGFTVIEAVNGKEALELYRRNPATIDLVMTDIGMPIMNGYELFFELKKLQPDLPIIISSGFGDMDIGSKIPPEEVAGIISKPYSPARLQEMLKSIFEPTSQKTV
ncbi:response regulator [Oryzomonas rubra]|uniref:histidine kinase n=1 Tax=Oryzomonas rubra TaxID=2509454 RepID=A0A5A9X489_9BACT|nr:response regulator [Oryzomonas rubra]KAA0887962.1 response regulator [Oryzomonas rubra]